MSTPHHNHNLTHDKADLESGRYSHDHGIPHNGTTTTLGANGDALHRTQTIMMPPWGGALQSGPWKPSFRKFGNPAPLGLCAFSLTTFVLSLINCQTRGVTSAGIVVGMAYGYGGLVQLLAGMWEMAAGNTFGATAFSSYGAFWISWALIETEGLGYTKGYATKADFHNAVGFFLLGWTVFTFLLFLCTLRSTVAFCTLFLFLDITFLILALGYLVQAPDGGVNTGLIKTGGVVGLVTCFIAFWNALSGLLDENNSFFTIPVMYFPWSERPKEEEKSD